MPKYVVEFFKKAYELINPDYVRSRRMIKLKELEESGALERMCTSKVHEMLGIRKWAHEF